MQTAWIIRSSNAGFVDLKLTHIHVTFSIGLPDQSILLPKEMDVTCETQAFPIHASPISNCITLHLLTDIQRIAGVVWGGTVSNGIGQLWTIR